MKKKILIISNNPLSTKKNNGKTIFSIFENYDKNMVRQLYFDSEIPEGVQINSYLQINEKQLIKNVLTSNSNISRIVKEDSFKESSDNSVKERGKKSQFFRLSREFIWKLNQNKIYSDIYFWLDDFKPDVIFFTAGDFGFIYNIVLKIKEKYNSKLITYYTDDYILPRKTLNIGWWIRRNLILKNMRIILRKTDQLLTISEKMKNTYLQLFKKDSKVVMNLSVVPPKVSQRKVNDETIKLIYAGGLHYDRDHVLNQLALAIKAINDNNFGKSIAKLYIYTNSKPDKKTLEKLNIPGASEYHGSLSSDKLQIELESSDIPVHVESFQKKNIESTRLSISTKIPEYISLGKPILAIGPKNVASMEYLENIAFCINTEKEIHDEILELFYNKSVQDELAQKAKDHSKNYIQMIAQNKIEKILRDLEGV